MRLFRRFRIIRTEREQPTWLLRFHWTATIAVLVSLGTIVLESGYRLALPPALHWAVRVFDFIVLGLFAADVFIGYLLAPSRREHLRARWLDLAVFVAVIISLAMSRAGIPFIAVRQAVVVGQALTRSRRFAGVFERYRLQPAQLLALSFLVLIAFGTLLLTFPSATADGRGAGLLDALFTSTSAVCVTGLIVRNTPVFFSRLGQLVILCLIQLGGLGIMTFSASLAVIFSRKLALTQRKAISTVLEESREVDVVRILRYILVLTLLAESAGALLLFIRWMPDYPRVGDALYRAVFHAVSAFCNAGFSVFPNSLESYASDFAVNLVITGLVISGGLGFVAVHELLNRNTVRHGPAYSLRRLSVHSRLVLATSGILLLGGAIVFFFVEYDNALAHLRLPGKLLAAWFQSVTPRTAGFNTVPFTNLRPVTLFLWVVLMFVGASPGGTGGGIKTSTLSLLFLAVRNRILSREEVEVGRRVIPKDTVYRATAIAAVSAALVALFFALLLATERAPFQAILFETVSAFGTVGLSTGLTPRLTGAGKLVVIVLMYTGRLGPLTLALAMRGRQSRLAVTYPDAKVMVG